MKLVAKASSEAFRERVKKSGKFPAGILPSQLNRKVVAPNSNDRYKTCVNHSDHEDVQVMTVISGGNVAPSMVRTHIVEFEVEEGTEGEQVIHVPRGYKVVEVEEEEDECCDCICGPNDSGASTFRASTAQFSRDSVDANEFAERDEFGQAILAFQQWLKKSSEENSRFMNKATQQVENMLLTDKELMRCLHCVVRRC